jgi:hypothetical protein
VIIVVGGQSRKVGKTRAVCDIISGTQHAGWIAIKITPHAHAPDRDRDTDTDRYLAAGAAEAHLLTGRPPIQLPAGGNRIIESNSILDQLTPDLFFLIEDPSDPDWKPSALPLRGRPGTIEVPGAIQPEHLQLVRSLLSRA